MTARMFMLAALAGGITLYASHAAAQGRALQGGFGGEVLATHVCGIHGYTLRVIRPDNDPASNARHIHVDKMARHFHATWNEVENLVATHPPNMLAYENLGNQVVASQAPDHERYCTRTGHAIPLDQNVYQVALEHAEDYTGTTRVFYDSNTETWTLTHLIANYNGKREQAHGTPLPPSCNQGCAGHDVSPGDGDDGWRPGTYTTADGEVHDWSPAPVSGGSGAGAGGAVGTAPGAGAVAPAVPVDRARIAPGRAAPERAAPRPPQPVDDADADTDTAAPSSVLQEQATPRRRPPPR